MNTQNEILAAITRAAVAASADFLAHPSKGASSVFRTPSGLKGTITVSSGARAGSERTVHRGSHDESSYEVQGAPDSYATVQEDEQRAIEMPFAHGLLTYVAPSDRVGELDGADLDAPHRPSRSSHTSADAPSAADLIEASSLGTPGARRLRERTSPADATAIIELSRLTADVEAGQWWQMAPLARWHQDHGDPQRAETILRALAERTLHELARNNDRMGNHQAAETWTARANTLNH